MTSQHSTATLGSLKRKPQRWPPIAGGVILAIVVIGAIGIWQVRHRTTTNPTEQEAATTASTTRPVTVPSIATRAADVPPTYYLADSPAHAQAVEARLEEANAVRVTSGEATLVQHVQWFDSIEAETRFWWAMDESNLLRGGHGMPAVSVVDLRGQSGATAEQPAGAGTGSVVPVAVDSMGGMSELYREQQALAGDTATRASRSLPGGVDSVTRELDALTAEAAQGTPQGGLSERDAERHPAAAEQPRARGTCGEDAQPITC